MSEKKKWRRQTRAIMERVQEIGLRQAQGESKPNTTMRTTTLGKSKAVRKWARKAGIKLTKEIKLGKIDAVDLRSVPFDTSNRLTPKRIEEFAAELRSMSDEREWMERERYVVPSNKTLLRSAANQNIAGRVM